MLICDCWWASGVTQASLVETYMSIFSWVTKIVFVGQRSLVSFLCSVAVGRHVVTVSNMCHHLSDILALNPLDSSFGVCLKFECNWCHTQLNQSKEQDLTPVHTLSLRCDQITKVQWMLHNCEQRGEDVVICNPGPPAGGFPIRQSMRPVGVCVWEREEGGVHGKTNVMNQCG